MLAVITAGTFDAAVTVERFAVAVVGSVALGATVAIVGGAVLQRIDDALLETTITLIIAYGGYLLAESVSPHLALSGALETVTAGVVLGARGRRVMSPTTRLQARATWQFLDFLANSLLFLLMGLALRPLSEQGVLSPGGAVWRPLLVAILAVTLARAIVVWGVALLLARLKRPLPRGWRTVLTWAGLRGAVSLAAGLSIPGALPQRNILMTLTFGVVLFTLLAQGLTIRIVMARLGLSVEEASRHDLEVARGRLQATEAGLRELDVLRRDHTLDADLDRRLEEEYTRRRRQLREHINAMNHGSEVLERQHEVEAMRRLLRVQREAIQDAYARGRLSHASVREIVDEIDRDLARLEPALDEDA